MFIIVSIIVLLLLYYFCIMLPQSFRTTRALRLHSQFQETTQYFQPWEITGPLLLPENILSSSGEPLLSWRLPYLFEIDFFNGKRRIVSSFDENNRISSFDVTKPWNDKSNEHLLNSRPHFYFYPYYLEPKSESEPLGNETCLLRVEEIHEKIKAGTLQEGEEEKAYLVVVEPEYAVPWTKPQDVSWKDLASGKVQLFTGGFSWIRYYNTQGRLRYLDKMPETLEEWREFCGVDD